MNPFLEKDQLALPRQLGGDQAVAPVPVTARPETATLAGAARGHFHVDVSKLLDDLVAPLERLIDRGRLLVNDRLAVHSGHFRRRHASRICLVHATLLGSSMTPSRSSRGR